MRNVPNLLKLARHLEKLPPEKFDMNKWCGTACCIAGHASNLSGNIGGYAPEAAAKWLGISANGRDVYWHPLFMPKRDSVMFGATPKQAAKVVRHFAKTGRVKWSLVPEAKGETQ